MKRCKSLVPQLIGLIVAICIVTLTNGAASFSQTGNSPAMTADQLDKLLAPVALYPDALLMQVLAASVNSQEVLDGGNWLLQNKSLEGDQLDSAACGWIRRRHDRAVSFSASCGHDVLRN